MFNLKMKDTFKIVLNVFIYIFNILYFIICCLFSSFLMNLSDLSFNILFPILIIFILPLLFFVLAFIKKDKDFNIGFFFGIEVPILLLAFFRMVFVRELTLFYLLLILSISICIIFYFIDLFKVDIKQDKLKSLTVFVYETPVIMGVYFSLIALFYIIPILIHIVWFFFKIDYINLFKNIISFISDFKLSYLVIGFVDFLYLLLFLAFLLMLFCVFLAAPITSCIVYIKEFFKKYKQYKNLKNCLIFAFLYILILSLSSFHFSDIDVSAEYNLVKNSSNYEELYSAADKILKKQIIIKNSILDEYLAELRYISDNDNKNIYKIYSDIGFNEYLSNGIQNIFNTLTYPFQYHKTFRNRMADAAYKELFDEDIQSGLKDRISKSVNSTFFAKQEAASLLDIDSKDVKIISRIINIEETETHNVYKITVTESYKNRTQRNKEVYYEFSLPYNTVITGLLLGNNLQYKAELSPKGAARKTYEKLIRRFSDPALLEKNGLRQYTLRVYPVVPYKNENDIQKVSFEYYAKIDNFTGKIPLPVIYQVRNAFMGAGSKFEVFLDGEKLNIDKNAAYIKTSKFESYPVLKKKKIAFLLDTSYSNKINWKKYIESQTSKMKGANNTFDYYFFNKFISEKMTTLEDVKQVNFSKTRRYDAYCSLKENYDAVIMLTDSSVFDSSEYIDCNNNSPLYVVHVDEKQQGKIPPYNKAFTNLIYKTNGYIFDNLNDALLQIMYSNNSNKSNENEDLEYKIKEPKIFQSAKLIDSILRNEDTEDIKVKEKIHNIALDAGIVSDYSSYIALINELQKKELESNEKMSDKFDADLKTGEDINLKQQNNIFGVPEPQDWILIFLLFLISTLYILKNKLKWIFQRF